MEKFKKFVDDWGIQNVIAIIVVSFSLVICGGFFIFKNNETPKTNKTQEINYPECDDINRTLKPMKKNRTEELQKVLNNCQYALNTDYSLWYRNTKSQGNGNCSSDEMIKNLFIQNPNVYMVHPIKYNTYYSGDKVNTNNEGYSTFEDLIKESEFYDGDKKLSQDEIDDFLLQNLPENINKDKNENDDISENYLSEPLSQNSNYSSNMNDNTSEADFGPYMKEIRKDIKNNWNPPKGSESKKVVLLFSIAKDGSLISVSVQESSGIQSVDKAAIDAVKLTSPFKPLPAEFKGDKVDIQFTFDYTVMGNY